MIMIYLHTEFVDILMIYLHTKFHIPAGNGYRFIA
jgi:phosphate starvation-inducible membrane PsiE